MEYDLPTVEFPFDLLLRNLLWILIPLAVIFIICAILIAIVQSLLKKKRVLILIFRFIIVFTGAFAYAALLPTIMKIILP